MIERAAVLGGGLMGSGTAETVAAAGLQVVVREVDEAAVEAAETRIAQSLAHAVARGKLDDAGRERMLERIAFTTIASNTSSIPIAQLAAGVARPERVLGLHFFSPVPVMKLVEVVVALDTSAETVATARAFCERIGKVAIETKDRSGFIVNMLLVPYLMAAMRMYEEGFATAEAIDEGMRLGCGHPMGPLALCDFIGLDVLYSVCDSLYEEFKRPEYAPPPLLKRMVASGRVGKKSGRGFFDYTRAREELAA